MADTTISGEAPAADTGNGDAPRTTIGEINLSFFYFFLNIRWGREKRGVARLRSDRTTKPRLQIANVPILAMLWMIIALAAYGLLQLLLSGLVILAQA